MMIGKPVTVIQVPNRRLFNLAAAVTRDIVALSKLLSYALECGEIDMHPLIRFPRLKEPKRYSGL